jgi:hypothetical protein
METLLIVVFEVSLLVVLLIICTGIPVRKCRTAERRADELLRAVLTLEEYHQLTQRGHVDIASPSDPTRVYRIPQYRGYVLVRVNGRVTEWLCLQPHKSVPDADFVAIHKLMIQANEDFYLQTANHRHASLQ